MKTKSHTPRWLILALLSTVTAAIIWAAAPLAGTAIGNQASATYNDVSGTPRQATSNTVTTVVQAVYSHTLVDNRNVTVSPGGQVSYPHVLTNTGNAPDTYTFGVTQGAGDDFDLNNVTIYADLNKDGIADNSTALSGTITLAAGAEYGYVITGSAPGTVTAGQTASISTTATSVNSGVQTNTDVATVTANAVINVTKTISSGSGPSPSLSDITYTLTYTNTGNTAATNVTITDVIPTGMDYQETTGRWSSTGSTILTDGSAADNQSGIIYDFGVTVANRVTAVIAVVNPGASGTLTFAVRVESGVAPTTIPNTAFFSYDPDGAGATAATTPAPTNTVPYIVTQNVGVEIGDVTAAIDLEGETAPTGAGLIGTVATAPAGSTVTFVNRVRNTGNGTDSFDITIPANTFPAGSSFIFYKSDGNTPLIDTNGNSVPDTGPLAPNGTYDVVVKATLPTLFGTAAPFTITVKAASKVDPTVAVGDNTAINTLTSVTTLTVDLTNNTSASAVGLQPGEGAGAEVSAVVTNSTDPAITTRFTLVAYNPNAVADTFDIASSTSSVFAHQNLPAGWTVVFRDSNGAVITNTGIILAGQSRTFFADVTPPAGYAPGTTELYFRVLSPTTNIQDIIHDAVTVNTVRNVSIAPNNSGQTFPGGAVVYEHMLTNNGNVTEGAIAALGDAGGSQIALTLVDSLVAQGWTSVIYYDSNNNGTLDPADPVVGNTSFISNGGAGLAPLESIRLFTKVFAPPGAPNLAIDTTTVTATTTNGTGAGGYVTTAPAAVSATDSTSVITGDLTLVKEQVLDADCDGTETLYSQAQITTGAVPGSCIKYRIVVTNTGAAQATNVVVYDSTPAYTTYSETPAAAVTGGTVNNTTAPVDGATGSFTFDVGTLPAGASATITFAVKIND